MDLAGRRGAPAGDMPKSNQPQSFAPVALRPNESQRDERLPLESPREYSPAVGPPSRSARCASERKETTWQTAVKAAKTG